MYLAVLPSYRRACIDILLKTLPNLEIYCSEAHLDATVKTGIPHEQYQRVGMIRIFGRVFIQYGHIADALRADDLVVDLNPRSLTAWLLLIVRRLRRGRRTVVWGHLHPQSGSSSSTRVLRQTMRRLSDGTITYTYSNRADAERELPGSPVWVAPNALYRLSELRRAMPGSGARTDVVYVGRLEPAKKVALLIDAFAASGLTSSGVSLVIVGTGSESEALRERVGDLRISDAVDFVGWVDGPDALKTIYDRAFASASPGFAGLGLTQSLGFGVPMIIADEEPHSPEIELASTGAVRWARSDSVASFAEALHDTWSARDLVPDERARDAVLAGYCAEVMAMGLSDAIRGGNTTHG